MGAVIKAGDVVVLKSGGPQMTVAWIEESEALCVWFDSQGQPKEKRYPLVVLEVDRPNQ